jgi:hypothetical protein
MGELSTAAKITPAAPFGAVPATGAGPATGTRTGAAGLVSTALTCSA